MRLIEVGRLGRVIATILALEVTLVLIHKPVGLMVSRHHRRLALLLLVMGILRLWRVPLWLLLLRMLGLMSLVRMLGLMRRKPLSRPLLPLLSLGGSGLSNDRILSIFRKPDRNPFSSMPKFEAPNRCHRILRLCLILIINKCDPLAILVPCQSNLIKAFKALEK